VETAKTNLADQKLKLVNIFTKLIISVFKRKFWSTLRSSPRFSKPILL